MIYAMTGLVRQGTPVTFIYNDQLELEYAFTTLGDTEDDMAVQEWLGIYKPNSIIAKEGPEMGGYKIREDPLRFFSEYIPKVYAFKPSIHGYDRMEEVPRPRGEETM